MGLGVGLVRHGVGLVEGTHLGGVTHAAVHVEGTALHLVVADVVGKS